MMLKHLFFNFYRKNVWLLSRIGRKYCKRVGDDRCELYVITIGYNHVRLIEKQIELVKRHVKDKDFQHIVVDNSPDRYVRHLIAKICEQENIEYVPVPHYIDRLISHRLFGNGLSHGAALNWMFYHFLKQRRPKRFVLLDHDIFPMVDYSLVDKLGGHDFYGVERIRKPGWYLWPGWCVFKFEAIEDKRPNFLPLFVDGTYLDAGGGNYSRMYCNYDVNTMKFPEVVTKRIKHTKDLTTHDDIYHGDCIQYIDHAWLHLINGSNCAHIPGKETLVNKMIDHIDELYEPN